MINTNYILIATAVLTMGLPAFSYAATYAFVDQAGVVRTVNADSSVSAAATAYNIDNNSGTMLLNADGRDNGIIGQQVYGM